MKETPNTSYYDDLPRVIGKGPGNLDYSGLENGEAERPIHSLILAVSGGSERGSPFQIGRKFCNTEAGKDSAEYEHSPEWYRKVQEDKKEDARKSWGESRVPQYEIHTVVCIAGLTLQERCHIESRINLVRNMADLQELLRTLAQAGCKVNTLGKERWEPIEMA